MGLGLSRVGTEINFVALTWQLYVMTKSPINLGLLGLFRALPVAILALGAGVVADAFDRRKLMFITQTILALTSTTLAVMTALGHASPALMYGATFVAASANSFDGPARQSLVPALVPADVLPGALGLSITTNQLAAVIGPGLGGLILGASSYGVVLCFAVDAVSFLAVIASLIVMSPPPARAKMAVSFGAALEGLRFLRRTPIIMWMMALDFVGTFFAGALLLMPIFAEEVLHVGRHGLGFLLAAPAVGAMAAAFIVSMRPPIVQRGRVILTAIVVYGLAIAGFGASKTFVLSLLFLAASGAADAVSTVVRQTIRQLLTPDELRGRMTSLNMIFFLGGPQLGEVEAGFTARWLGPPLSVVCGGLICAFFATSVALGIPAIRNHRA